MKSFIDNFFGLSYLRWLPWVALGGILMTVLLHLAFTPPWLEGLPGPLQAAFWGGVVLAAVFIYAMVVTLRRSVEWRRDWEQRIALAESKAVETHQRLEAVLRLTHKFLEASDEREIVEMVLRLSVDWVGAMGASLVPLDERGQPMTAVNYGDLPAPVFTAWVEYLASPAIRQRCSTCQNHGAMARACPLLKGPFPEAVGLYCLPLRRGEREFGVLNLYLPKGHRLTPESQAFLNAMVDETALVLESMRLRRRELSALSQVQAVRRRTDLEGLLKDFLENLRDTLEADFAYMFADPAENDAPTRTLTSGEMPAEVRPFIDGVLQGVLASKKPVLLGEVTGEPAASRKLSSLLAAPLLSQQGNTMGAVLIGNVRAKNFSRRHLMLMRTLAGQVALILQNVNLMAELEYKAMMAERTRLAREIHDGLAQTLGFLKLQSAQMKNILDQGDMERLEQTLDLSYQTLSEAYLDARQAIDSLRIHAGEEGIVSWLKQTVIEFRENSGFAVELSVEECVAEMPSEVQAQLIRIVQEALNNVRKHSRASQAWVDCCVSESDLLLEVRDDGVGFTPEDVPGTSRYGLQGMQERAELIGADFQVVSCPEEGTIISVRLPMAVGET